MRVAYWSLLFVTLAAAIAGIVAFPVSIAERDAAVAKNQLESWYLWLTIVCLVIGAGTGVVACVLARRRLNHRPGESAPRFHARVIRSGFGAALVTALLSIGCLAFGAMMQSAWQIGQLQRALLVLWQGRAMTPVGLGVSAMFAVFAFTSRTMLWGGRYAIVAAPAPTASVKNA